MRFLTSVARMIGMGAMLALGGCGSDGGGGVSSVSGTSTATGSSVQTPVPITPAGLSTSTSFTPSMQSGTFVSIPSTAGTYVSYDATSNTYTLNGGTSAPSYTFTSHTTDPTEVSGGLDTSGTGNLGSRIYILTHTGNAFVYSYTAVAAVHSEGTGFAQYTSSSADNVAVFGMPTPAAAVPRTGSATYALDLLGTYTGTGTGSVNFASGTYNFSGNITKVGSFNAGNGIAQTAVSGTFSSAGTLASNSNGFSGSINLALNQGATAYNGQLGGMFFGPAAQELGATFVASAASSNASAYSSPIAGAILGHK